MSIEANEAIVIQMHEALSAGDIPRAMSCWAPNAINHGRFAKGDPRLQQIPSGPDGLKRIMESLHTAFPDRQWQIEDLIAAGDKVVCRMTVSGTHQGTPIIPVEGGLYLKAVPPTGKPYRVQHIHIYRIADGKIAEHWAVRDDLSLLEEVGGIVPNQKPEMSARP